MVNLKRGLVEQIYEEIHERILTLKLKPGSRINLYELEKELEVSPTPIKGALKKLAARGLVIDKNRTGYYTVSLSTKKINEIYFIRNIFETHALETSISLFPKEKLKIIQTGFLSLLNEKEIKAKYNDFYSFDQAIHLGIINYSNNQTLIDLYYQIYDFVKISQHSYHLELDEMIKQIHVHLLIIESLIKRDLIKSKKTIEKHIMDVKKLIIKSIENNNKLTKEK